MTDTPAAPSPTPTPAPAPAPAPQPVTGELLIPVVGPRPLLDPGDSRPLGHPVGTTPAPVPPGAIDEKAIN